MRTKGEIIWRITYLIDATGDTAHAEPAILLLADRKGWSYLASEFAAMAKRKVAADMVASGDPDDHQHLEYKYTPVNAAFSHHFEFRLGLLDPKSRIHTLKKYDIKRLSADVDLPHIFKRLIRTATDDARNTKRLIRKASKLPKMSDEDLYAAFGMKAPKLRAPSQKNRRRA